MKKAMLFFAALLFSVNASAATLNLVGDAANAGTVNFSSGQVVTAGWTSTQVGGEAIHDVYTLTTNAMTGTRLLLTFNPLALGTEVKLFEGGSLVETFTAMATQSLGTIDYLYVFQVGVEYMIDIFIPTALAGSNYDLRVETPIPAALWLFAPALLGFFGLRRKARSLAA